MPATGHLTFGPMDPVVSKLAACRGKDPELFFAPPGQGQAARAICASCPVRFACLEEALASGPSLQGIWGGTSHRQRMAMLSTRKLARR